MTDDSESVYFRELIERLPFEKDANKTCLLQFAPRYILFTYPICVRIWVGPLDVFSSESLQNHSDFLKKNFLVDFWNDTKIFSIKSSLNGPSSWASDVTWKYVNSPPQPEHRSVIEARLHLILQTVVFAWSAGPWPIPSRVDWIDSRWTFFISLQN